MFSLQSLDLSDISDFDDILSASNQNAGGDSTISSLGRHTEILEDMNTRQGVAVDETLYSGNRQILTSVEPLDPPDDPFAVDHTRSFYKGTSFSFGGYWQEEIHYLNNEVKIDELNLINYENLNLIRNENKSKKDDDLDSLNEYLLENILWVAPKDEE